eukprot:14681483-Alexandrium_andersonii.AAC.1
MAVGPCFTTAPPDPLDWHPLGLAALRGPMGTSGTPEALVGGVQGGPVSYTHLRAHETSAHL